MMIIMMKLPAMKDSQVIHDGEEEVESRSNDDDDMMIDLSIALSDPGYPSIYYIYHYP